MNRAASTTLTVRRIAGAWVWALPLLGLVALVLSWERELPGPLYLVVGAVLIGVVLAAVHHAEVIAHRVGEPYGSLVLAVSVTVIEVALIITLMLSKPSTEASTLARDTAFAAVMITINGIVGLSILVGSLKHNMPRFNPEGAGSGLAVVMTLTTLTLVVPSFTISEPGARFTPLQLAFVATAAIVLYGAFVLLQTGRHRDFFLPVGKSGEVIDEDDHSDPPSARATLASLGLLLASLVAVVGLAKAMSPAIEDGVDAVGIPESFVGVIVALVVLLPEGLAATKAAARNRLQTSLNLGIGSAMATIGLTIPSLAVASIWLPTPLTLGLGPVQIVLLLLTGAVATLTVVPGRATRLQGTTHLVLFASFLFLSASP
ncbi:calcium:proton antiporter [Homoserinibacter sp. GY 40078]|uniref:calcium:proton antiporter n=1 Tax=Homoserinibacter sp. GY 40078 TaxID=2603275 RepID=UPI0011CBC485|nr:calcium:proton antiporter [Homoserinibacter sp. GY 40078]TXK17102.1 calcium:proton antiporter [Homoserinibacter sp. GY 40078]